MNLGQEKKCANILVIDDDETITDLVKTVLSSDGHDVVCANSGAEGLQQASDLHPDLIFVDITMPDLTGYEVTEHLKAKPDLANTPIIYLTGRSASEDGGRSFATGGLAYIRKPFVPKQLRDLVALTLQSIE